MAAVSRDTSLDDCRIDVEGWQAHIYRTPKGNCRIVTLHPEVWQGVVGWVREVVDGHHRRTAMRTAYHAKTRRRNRRRR